MMDSIRLILCSGDYLVHQLGQKLGSIYLNLCFNMPECPLIHCSNPVRHVADNPFPTGMVEMVRLGLVDAKLIGC